MEAARANSEATKFIDTINALAKNKNIHEYQFLTLRRILLRKDAWMYEHYKETNSVPSFKAFKKILALFSRNVAGFKLMFLTLYHSKTSCNQEN